MKDTLGLVPQVFYDLIGRVIPGAALIVLTLVLFLNDVQLAAVATSFMRRPGALLAAVTIVGLVGAYLVGLVLGAIVFRLTDDRRSEKTFADVPQKSPEAKLEKGDLPYVYDFILITDPAAGTRLVKLRAESHLCGVLIMGCALLILFYVPTHWPLNHATAWLVISGLAATIIAAVFFRHHLTVRAWRLQINCWMLLNKPKAPESERAAVVPAHETPDPAKLVVASKDPPSAQPQ